jgi:glycogen synthase
MFHWIISLFRQNKVEVGPIDDEPSTIIKPQIIHDNDYADIISKLSLDDTFFTSNDIKYMFTLSNAQLIYLVLLKLED